MHAWMLCQVLSYFYRGASCPGVAQDPRTHELVLRQHELVLRQQQTESRLDASDAIRRDAIRRGAPGPVICSPLLTTNQ